MSEPTWVRFGNPTPQMQTRVSDPRTGATLQVSERARHINQSVTTAEMWPGFDAPEMVELALSTRNDPVLALIGDAIADEHRRYAVGLSELMQIVNVHTGGGRPAWVDSNDEAFAQALGRHFDCPVGEPTMLFTNAGRDAMHAQHLSTAAQPAAFTYMALTANNTRAATDTTLAGEIATAGLARAQCTFAHTTGTNTSTLTHTFTAQAADVAGGAVTVPQIGIFNASSAGTLGYETPLSSSTQFAAAGDNSTITWTDQIQ